MNPWHSASAAFEHESDGTSERASKQESTSTIIHKQSTRQIFTHLVLSSFFLSFSHFVTSIAQAPSSRSFRPHSFSFSPFVRELLRDLSTKSRMHSTAPAPRPISRCSLCQELSKHEHSTVIYTNFQFLNLSTDPSTQNSKPESFYRVQISTL